MATSQFYTEVEDIIIQFSNGDLDQDEAVTAIEALHNGER